MRKANYDMYYEDIDIEPDEQEGFKELERQGKKWE